MIRNRIKATSMKRVTSSDTLYSEPHPMEKAKPFNGVNCVLRARWKITAGRWQQWRDDELVATNECNGDDLQHSFMIS
jgi:hypothetical protein